MSDFRILGVQVIGSQFIAATNQAFLSVGFPYRILYEHELDDGAEWAAHVFEDGRCHSIWFGPRVVRAWFSFAYEIAALQAQLPKDARAQVPPLVVSYGTERLCPRRAGVDLHLQHDPTVELDALRESIRVHMSAMWGERAVTIVEASTLA